MLSRACTLNKSIGLVEYGMFFLITDPYGDLLEAPTFDGEDEERDVEEEGEEEAIRKYQALLQGIQAEDRRKEDKGVEMEVSWGLGESDNISIFQVCCPGFVCVYLYCKVVCACVCMFSHISVSFACMGLKCYRHAQGSMRMGRT